MRILLFIVLLAFVPLSIHAGGKLKSWKNLSRPEKVWAVCHPFKARTVYECAQRARSVSDSLEKTGDLTGRNGGQLDAFRHAYWMALMVQYLPERAVRKVGEKHEKGNYIDFRKGRLEDSVRADSMSCVMDLRNNEAGIGIGKDFSASHDSMSLAMAVLVQLWNGKLWIMSKNVEGGYLDCDNKPIDLTQYDNKWYIPKCLVSSDRIVVPH